jgi:hypothetical protein
MRIFILFIFILTFSFSEEKLIISKIENLKTSYFNNQVVHLKLNTIIAKGNEINVSIPNAVIKTKTDDNTTFYTDIYFLLKDEFPIVKISLLENYIVIDEMNLTLDSKINSLTPPLNFSNVIANELKIKNISSSIYDDNSNLLSLEIEANESNLEEFSIKISKEQEIEYNNDFINSKVLYYAIIPNIINQVDFSYFNLKEKKYINKIVKINPKNEKISTQSDINPTDNNYLIFINISIASLIFLWLVLFYFRRKWMYLVLIILAVLSLIFFNLPNKEMVLKEKALVHILPTPQSTIFLIVGIDTKVEILDSKNGYKKIMINSQVGWVKDKYVTKN